MFGIDGLTSLPGPAPRIISILKRFGGAVKSGGLDHCMISSQY
jgi:hypothetical protein